MPLKEEEKAELEALRTATVLEFVEFTELEAGAERIEWEVRSKSIYETHEMPWGMTVGSHAPINAAISC